MRICHVIDNLSLDRGGPVAVVAGLAMAQQRRGDCVSVVCRSIARSGDRSGRIAQVDPGALLVQLQRVGGGRTPIADALDVLRPDVVHAHGVWEPIQRRAAAWASRRAVPFVLSSHGMLHPVPMADGRLKKRAYLWLLGAAVRQAHCVFVTNDAERANALRLGARSAVVLANGVDVSEVRGTDAAAFRQFVPSLGSRSFVLFLGRIHEIKGIKQLVRSFAILRRGGASVDLVLAGPEDGAGAAARKLAEALGIASHVHFSGAVYGALKASALAGCELLVHRPRYEGFGMNVIEAMDARKAVVTSAVTGAAQSAPQGSIEVAEDSDAGFARAVASLLADDRRRAAVAERGRAWVESELTWDAIARQLGGLYLK